MRELAAYGCRTVMHVVRLLAPGLDQEDHAKDIDFSRAGIRARLGGRLGRHAPDPGSPAVGASSRSAGRLRAAQAATRGDAGGGLR
ncbi:DUF3734 domain-containing protein [Dankookia sp. P2]|uniref:DUF3734 domain-containing protein n=1 Tax=Dankookia sp. P2 TaxID=3423955 RepID=UPI003D664044